MLVGRDEERLRIEGVLASARERTSSVLVLRGEAGIGKTALLEQAAASADGMRVLRTRGIQTESELAFACLLELLRPLLAYLDRLPERQAAALKGALALEAAAEDDSFAVYAGTLNLLAAAAEEEPLLVLIDDAHWLDHGSAEALAFASRRLGDERIAVLWAIREGEAAVSSEGLDEIVLDGIEPDAAVELVAATADGVATEAARSLAALTNGNPLALIELPQLLTDAQRDGREPLEQPLPASPALRDAFGRRLERLPEEVLTMLLIAAASDSTDVATIGRAWQSAGFAATQLEPAERAGLVTIREGQLEFRHPLVRAAVYAGADAVERREAHRVLAEALYDARTQSRRAWHRALAAVGPDESVAADLETVAARSQGRSWHAAARAYEQAARLTPDDETRSRRLLAAAREWQAAGRGGTAEQLLAEAMSLTEDPLVLADIEHLRGRELVNLGRPREAAELLERAARRIIDTAPERAALILAEAADASVVAGDLDRAEEWAGRAWELGARPGGAATLWVALRYGDVLGWRGDVERATELWLSSAEIPAGDNLRNRCAIGEALFSAGEDDRACEVLEATVGAARSSSSLGLLPYALHVLSMAETRRGRLRAGISAATEAHELAVALDQPGESVRALGTLAWIEALLGREDECRARIRDAVALRRRLGDEPHGSVAEGMLDLSLGRFEAAITNFEARAAETPIEADGIAPISFVPSLVEAYARARRAEEARAALVAYEPVARRSGRPAALAPALRCRAILDGEADEFEAALAEHDRWGNPFERARTQLSYGEFLRREKQRVDARAQLRAALEAFEDTGAVSWAERTRTELRATGERARRREPSTLDDLTPQELNVARLVCEGLTNREVAERLFLSPKTIETHLVHVFRKVGVRSRTELAVALAGSGAVVPA